MSQHSKPPSSSWQTLLADTRNAPTPMKVRRPSPRLRGALADQVRAHRDVRCQLLHPLAARTACRRGNHHVRRTHPHRPAGARRQGHGERRPLVLLHGQEPPYRRDGADLAVVRFPAVVLTPTFPPSSPRGRGRELILAWVSAQVQRRTRMLELRRRDDGDWAVSTRCERRWRARRGRGSVERVRERHLQCVYSLSFSPPCRRRVELELTSLSRLPLRSRSTRRNWLLVHEHESLHSRTLRGVYGPRRLLTSAHSPLPQAAQHIVEFLVHFYQVFPEFVNHDVRPLHSSSTLHDTDDDLSIDLHRRRILRRCVRIEAEKDQS